jgi:hypothetical protein
MSRYLNPGGRISSRYGPFAGATAPSAGTDEVQTITVGGTPTGGTFRLRFRGEDTADIAWSATNATLVANIDAALGALGSVGGADNVTVAAGTLTAGIGTITVTFVAALGKKAVPTIQVASNDLTGTSPTVAVAETTPGVTATARGVPKGATYIAEDTGVHYSNTGTTSAPTWTVIGSQT